MIVYLAALLLLTQVEALTTDGESVVGELRTWNGEGISVHAADDETRVIPLERLQQWRPLDGPATNPNPVPEVTVKLRAGSCLAGEQVTVAEGSLQLTATDGRVNLPLRSVQSIRLRPESAEWDAEWQRMMDRPFAGDALVIRRGSQRLDFLEGSISRITAESVKFQYDEQIMDVPRSRLEGIVLFQPAEMERAMPAFVVTLRNGSRWNGLGAVLQQGQLQVRLAEEIELETALHNVAEVSFASGNISFVSDMLPEQVVVQPMWDSRFASQAVEAFLYQPHWNRGFAGRDLQLQMDDRGSWQTFEKGIALHGQTRLLFRLQQPFRELRGLVGFDPELGRRGTARLTIRADGVDVFAEEITHGVPPRPISVPLKANRRIEIELSPLDGFDLGDFVNLCHLRLIK